MELHIGHLIKEKLEKTGMTKSEFARRINKTSQNVYDIFERKSIDTGLLAHISDVLEYNFFEILSHQFVASRLNGNELNEPTSGYYSTKDLVVELQSKEHAHALCILETKQLQKEINYLKQINELLREKRR